MKKVSICLADCLAVGLALGLCACLSPWKEDEAYITLELTGDPEDSYADIIYPLPKEINELLEHDVYLAGPAGMRELRFDGSTPIRVLLAEGYWNIRVLSYLDGSLFAQGDAVTEVKYSGNKTVAVGMRPVFIVTGVMVSPPEPLVNRSATQPFSAKVGGNGTPPQAVTWKVEGNSYDDTAIDADGILFVSPYESPNTQLTITATSAVDNSKSGSTQAAVSDLINAMIPMIRSNYSREYEYSTGATADSLDVQITNRDWINNQNGTITYQWYKNSNDDNTSGTEIPGATGASFVPPTTADAAGTVYYYIVVTNTIPDNGDGGIKSQILIGETVKVTVNPINALLPVLIGIPANPFTYSTGITANSITIDVINSEAITGQGGVLSYQWYGNNTNSATGGNPVSGANTASFTPPTNTTGTTYYYVVVTNTLPDSGDGGTKSAAATSNAVTINVTDDINAIYPQLTGIDTTDQEYDVGAAGATLSVTVTNIAAIEEQHVKVFAGYLVYQWYRKDDLSDPDPGTPISGETNASFTIPTTPDAANNGNGGVSYYSVVVTNSLPPGPGIGMNEASATSIWVKITVNPINATTAPIVSISPATAQTRTVDEAANQLTAEVSNLADLTAEQDASSGDTTYAGTTYQWYRSSSLSTTFGIPISGEESDTFIPPTGPAAANNGNGGISFYYVVVTNTIKDNGDGGTKSITETSNAVQVTVDPINAIAPATVTVAPPAQTVTQGGTPTLTATVSPVALGTLSYQWYSNSSNSTGGTAISGATNLTYSPDTSTAGAKYYYVVVTNTITDNGDGGTKTATATSNVVGVTVEAADP